MKLRNSNKGFTLIELLVAMTVFLVVIGVSSGIFIQTIRTQRIVTDLSKSLSNVTLALEQISREARTGYGFNAGGDELRFVTSRGEAVTYELVIDDDRGVIERNGEPITSENVNISNLNFIARDRTGGDEMPWLVTISTTVLGEKDIAVNLQTSVSSRIIGF